MKIIIPPQEVENKSGSSGISRRKLLRIATVGLTAGAIAPFLLALNSALAVEQAGASG